MSETAVPATPKASKTVHTPVTMSDGRVVQFAGERKVENWVRRQRWVSVDFSDAPGALDNMNAPDDWFRLELGADKCG